MKAYELLYFVAPNSEEEKKNAVKDRISSVIESDGGKVDNVEDWGTRKLAYEIGELSEADYTLVDFHAKETEIAELDRVLRISDSVVRHMITARPDKD
jgi:small subunit ribosomal protein S6